MPGIVWAPGRIQSGSVSDELILTFDIMPSSMALAGIKAPDGHQIDGINVNTALFDNAELPPVKRFWSMWGDGALRDGDWKLVVIDNQNMLFQIKEDPQETTDIAAQYPERTEEMRGIYDSMLVKTTADSPYPKAK